MQDLKKRNTGELEELRTSLEKRYREFQSRNLRLDMTRGKPCPEQLDLSMEMLECVTARDYSTSDGQDCRNYGGLEGIPEARELFSRYLEVGPEEIMIGGNSSLNMMCDVIMSAMVHGMVDSQAPWGHRSKIRFLCPTPGYDRHFAICQHLQIEMIPVALKEDGPEMDLVEKMVAEDETIKGIWCVPRYSNPTGITYSDDVVDRLATMKTKAEDFRIFWDNAYAVHHLTDLPAPLKDILSSCKQAGNPERVFLFGSTSKITFAGAGLAMMAGSRKNIEWKRKQMAVQTIGPDKLNQLRHVRFLKDMAGIENHMKKHAAILRPKFEAVHNIFEKELGGKNIATWSQPEGGYFISLDILDDCASSVVHMSAEGGVRLTPAGATFPYSRDPQNRNIRIAPTFPPVGDIVLAMELLCACIQIVSIHKIMAKAG